MLGETSVVPEWSWEDAMTGPSPCRVAEREDAGGDSKSTFFRSEPE